MEAYRLKELSNHGTASAQPLYQQIIEDIKHKIEEGVYTEGMRIEGEKDLMQEYGVSRITVRRAITDLCIEGYLSKHQGLGTFVQIPKIKKISSDIEGFSVSCAKQGFAPSYRLLHTILVSARPNERQFLRLDEDCRLIYTRRILLADGIPIMLENLFFPFTKQFQFILENPLDQPMYPLLNQYGIMPSKDIKGTLETASASPEIANLMKVSEGSPMFYRIAHMANNARQPLFIERSYIVGARFIIYL